MRSKQSFLRGKLSKYNNRGKRHPAVVCLILFDIMGAVLASSIIGVVELLMRWSGHCPLTAGSFTFLLINSGFLGTKGRESYLG